MYSKNQHKRSLKIRRAMRELYEDYTSVPQNERHSVRRQNVIDVLTDLRHFADVYGISFYDALDTSYNHYLVEKGSPETPE